MANHSIVFTNPLYSRRRIITKEDVLKTESTNVRLKYYGTIRKAGCK